jgi:hypothetical protein
MRFNSAAQAGRWTVLAALVPAAVAFAAGEEAATPPLQNGIRITLKNDFIKTYKDRVTITAHHFTVDKAHPKPNPPAKDGDLHAAGRDATDIGLATVAEVMNAKDKPGSDAVQLIHGVEGKGKTLAVTGAWRLWCEHGGTKPQTQGEELEPFTTTNPPHVFEIHPITAINDTSVLGSLRPILKFKTKDAHDAFVNYENLPCRIVPGEGTTTLISHMAGYNYVEFILELLDAPKGLADGTEAMCNVRDLDGDLLVRRRRMVFVKGSEPEKQVKGLKAGNRLHVLGLPRIDLKLVSWRVENAQNPKYKNDSPLNWNLPYEIIVAGTYGPPDND